jgi:hypothetical protein
MYYLFPLASRPNSLSRRVSLTNVLSPSYCGPNWLVCILVKKFVLVNLTRKTNDPPGPRGICGNTKAPSRIMYQEARIAT